ncbi:TadE/TadG family type IV pilus assembly protein [Roseomonas xinghualingensis]|uniref:TadE/TadG family type IV pilus assembly protein n=1 Tax=Roseomonas xinghualingensis TaxID=2986475 RepID=UPI0021F1CD76|nr:TadE/TadG family type IV pilus assembly protein [Roseomonas sp. SXEYE001]MCV4208706.1 pilus assembly protein [Roseomonas sp. SXEYE001]
MNRITKLLVRCRRGVSALEFAFVAPILALLVMGGIDLGNAVQQTLRLEAAARAGAQYAFSRPDDANGITAAIRANLQGWSDITIPLPAKVCRCPNGNTVPCQGSSCGNDVPAIYVSVRVTRPFTASTPISAAVIPPTTLRGHVELRLR